ncbi:MAG TPA: class I SAM-dependent methyltransferase [Sedimentisphaerales bacterium]|nr:class I SAM-dependent methyltransferase [Sedimentisphaerales bacterium]
MSEVNLMDFYPRAKRDLNHRVAVGEEDRRIAKQFGREFFDGTRDQGYGGYRYDGRWVPVVKRMKDYYGLADKTSVLDVGCGKGFMLHDFKQVMPKCTVAGLDISEYAIANAMADVKPFLAVGNCKSLPYPDDSFDFAVSINTVHNLKRDECAESIRQIECVARKNKFIVVDAYRDEQEKKRMLKWNLTAETILHVDDWKQLFEEAGYTGDYYWFTP